MSLVTSVAVTFSLIDQDLIESVQNFFRDHYQRCFLKQVNEDSGGNKAMEEIMLIGAYNYFDLRAFLYHLKSLTWEVPATVQLHYHKEDEDHWGVMNIFS